MAILPQPHLFSWREIDAASDLDRLRLVLSALPDEGFVQFLEKQRGAGRDDYPVRPTWNALVAGVVYQHPTAAALLRELWRNAELRELCGFDPVRGGAAVPSEDAFGHFIAAVMEAKERLLQMFHELVQNVEEVLPDLGTKMAVDSKAVPSYGKPVTDGEKREEDDRRRDTDADWGKKTYRGTRKDGTQWEKVKSWFGYKLHLLVDSHYELPLAFSVDKASSSDSPTLLPLVDDLKKNHPSIHENAEELSADKGYDSNQNNRDLYNQHDIKPVIDKRTMWKDGELTRPLYSDRVDSFVYDEDGNVCCICPATGELRNLFFAGFEHDRETLRYRCPAAANEYFCKGRVQCEAKALTGVGEFGRVVRVPLELDHRIFTPIARHTDKWKRAYNRRSAVERVNSRLDNVLGFEKHTIRGQAKMETRITLALIVMLAMALGRIRANQPELMRSLTQPVRRAA